MKLFRPPAFCAALGLFVWLGASPPFALRAARASRAESLRAAPHHADLLTHDEERAVGQRLAYFYARRHPPSKDTATRARLDRVSSQLHDAIGVDAPDIIVVKSARPGAVCFPPRKIFISSSLLELTRTDDELAAVIAHEMAHVARRHLARLIKLTFDLPPAERERFPTREAIITGQVSHFVFPPALDGASRRYEMEADQQAVVWMKHAGYRVAALATVLDGLASRLSPREQQERASLRARVASLVHQDSDLR